MEKSKKREDVRLSHFLNSVTMKEYVKPGLISSTGGHLPVYTVSGIKVSVFCHCCHLFHYHISTLYWVLRPVINQVCVPVCVCVLLITTLWYKLSYLEMCKKRFMINNLTVVINLVCLSALV